MTATLFFCQWVATATEVATQVAEDHGTEGWCDVPQMVAGLVTAEWLTVWQGTHLTPNFVA